MAKSKWAKIVFVDGGDWQGLYVDGKLKLENHSLDVGEVLEAIGVKFCLITANDEWLGERGCLPDTLDEVEQE